MKNFTITVYYDGITTENQGIKADKKIFNFISKLEKNFDINYTKSDYFVEDEQPFYGADGHRHENVWADTFDYELSNDVDKEAVENWIFDHSYSGMIVEVKDEEED